MEDMIQIRKAIIANRGGWEEASDQELMSLWQQFRPEVREQYLNGIKEKPEIRNPKSEKEKKHAADAGP